MIILKEKKTERNLSEGLLTNSVLPELSYTQRLNGRGFILSASLGNGNLDISIKCDLRKAIQNLSSDLQRYGLKRDVPSDVYFFAVAEALQGKILSDCFDLINNDDHKLAAFVSDNAGKIISNG